ncbi:hypothetical protein pb186bvf_011509 [Paramecium bursaria]
MQCEETIKLGRMCIEYEDEVVKKISVSSQSTNISKSREDSSPNVACKLEASDLEEDSFNLDDIFYNSDISHISENGISCEKWQDESIDMIIYKKEIDPEEEHKKANILQILTNIEQPPIVRLPQQIRDIVLNNKLQVHSIVPLRLECQWNHLWVSDLESFVLNPKCPLCKTPQSTPKTGSCPQPNQSRSKQEQKKLKLESQRRIYQKYEQEQNELYDEATKALSFRSNNIYINAFRQTEQEVDKAARQHALKFCTKSPTIDQSFLNLIQAVYKILLLPEKPLEQYVRSQSQNILRQEYRTYARLVHPDKNRHPQAGVAFKKLKKYWYEIPKKH